jgi:FtsP/CotA-like multicopper oxidase with cupredoxin domain
MDRPKPTRRGIAGALAALPAVALCPAAVFGQQPARPAPLPAPAGATTPSARMLVAAPARARIRPAQAPEVNVWGFDGQVPGPVLRLRQGQETTFTLDNRTTVPLSLDVQGLRLSAERIGKPVAPGARGVFSVLAPDAGTFLYRSRVPGHASEATDRGLSGMLIVEPAEPYPVDQEVLLLVDDWLFGDDGQIAPFDPRAPGRATAGRLGGWLTVNGRPIPDRTSLRPGSRIRVRIASACNARIMRLRFDNLKPYVAAIDGQPTDTFEPLRASLPVAPGTRYDLIIDLPDTADAEGAITALVGPGVPLAILRTAGEPMARSRAPLPPIGPLPANPLLPPGIRLQDSVRASFTISGGARTGDNGQIDLAGIDLTRPWQVNGTVGTADSQPFLKLRRGQPAVITVANQTAFQQPLAIEGHAMRLLHPLDDGWEPYFADTLIIPEFKTMRIAFLGDNPGRWRLASAIAERFDAGLWGWFEVT